jgi:hypothetical protein
MKAMSFNFGNVFAYLELATGAVASVGTLQHLVKDPAPVTTLELVGIAQPVIQAVEAIFPKVNVPMDLVSEIATAAADAINRYFKKQPAVLPAIAPGGLT